MKGDLCPSKIPNSPTTKSQMLPEENKNETKIDYLIKEEEWDGLQVFSRQQWMPEDRLPLSILQHPWGGSNSAVHVVSTYNEVLSLKKEQNSDKWYNTDESENMLNEISWTQTVWVHLHEVPRRGKFTDRKLIRGNQRWGRRGNECYYLMHTELLFGVIKNFKEWLYDNVKVYLHAQSLQSCPALWPYGL